MEDISILIWGAFSKLIQIAKFQAVSSFMWVEITHNKIEALQH